MPVLTKKIIHNFHGNKKTKENMEKYNLIYPFNTDVELSVLDLKLIAPQKSDVHIECECDTCGRKFTKTLLRTDLEDIKNDYIVCNVCKRSATNQEKFGKNYPFSILTAEKIKQAKEKERLQAINKEIIDKKAEANKEINKEIIDKNIIDKEKVNANNIKESFTQKTSTKEQSSNRNITRKKRKDS